MDDLLVTGPTDSITTTKAYIAATFETRDLGRSERVLGIQLDWRKDGSIRLHH